MVDVVVDELGSNVEICDCVEAVEEGDNVPDGVEASQCSSVFRWRVLPLFLRYALVGSIGLPCCSELDQVGNEQVGWNEEVEEQAGNDV